MSISHNGGGNSIGRVDEPIDIFSEERRGMDIRRPGGETSDEDTCPCHPVEHNIWCDRHFQRYILHFYVQRRECFASFFFLIKLNLCMEIFGWKIFEKFYSIKINSNVEIFFLSKKFISLLSIVNNETTTDEIHCILSTMEIENFCRRLYIFFFFSHSF